MDVLGCRTLKCRAVTQSDTPSWITADLNWHLNSKADQEEPKKSHPTVSEVTQQAQLCFLGYMVCMIGTPVARNMSLHVTVILHYSLSTVNHEKCLISGNNY